MYIAHFSYLSKKGLDPGAVNHFFGQLLVSRGETTVPGFRLVNHFFGQRLDGRGETTVPEFRLELVLP